MPFFAIVLFLTVTTTSGLTAQTSVTLQACAEQFGENALCGWYEVPEDRSNPHGRRIQLRVVVFPARISEPAEPIVWLPGGPGQAASDLIPLGTQLLAATRETRDLVFIGQRGTGESNPLQCPEDVTAQPSLAFGQLFDPGRIAECYRETLGHADPTHYSTKTYVEDLAEVLSALGYDRVLFWGGSGGTRTAQVFLREYPERVVAMALDGVTPIDYAMPLPFSRGVEDSWTRVVEDCAAQATCADAFPDLDMDLDAIVDRFAAGPVHTSIRQQDGGSVPVVMSRGDFAYAVRGILYNANATAFLPLRIHEASETDDLSFFAQSLFNRMVVLRGNIIAMGLHLASYCAEDVPRLENDTVRQQTAGTLLGDYLVREYRGACNVWPVSPMPADWYRPARSDVPTLILSGYYDPSTPATAGERVAAYLPNNLHIIVRNSGHGSGFTCARETVERFLVNGSLDGLVDPCPQTPIVFEVGASR